MPNHLPRSQALHRAQTPKPTATNARPRNAHDTTALHQHFAFYYDAYNTQPTWIHPSINRLLVTVILIWCDLTSTRHALTTGDLRLTSNNQHPTHHTPLRKLPMHPSDAASMFMLASSTVDPPEFYYQLTV